MPPKEAPGASVDEVTFLKLCLQHYKGSFNKADFNFDAIAKECGAKSGQAAYQRFWSVKQKWGMAGAMKKGEDSKMTATTPTKKRGRPTKATKEDDAVGGSTPNTANTANTPVLADESEAETGILGTPSKAARTE